MQKAACVFLSLASAACFAAEDAGAYKSLFNGRDLTGWRHHGPVKKNNAWQVQNGILNNDLRSDKSGSDLYTEGTFKNFTLHFEFMVPEGSNSGVYLRGRHEIQLTGDYSAKKIGPAGNGAIWNIKSPDAYASKPSGEWQTMEVTMTGRNLTATLNGTKIHNNVVCDKVTGGGLDNRLDAPGPIMFQGRLGSIKLRNIRIKELPN